MPAGLMTIRYSVYRSFSTSFTEPDSSIVFAIMAAAVRVRKIFFCFFAEQPLEYGIIKGTIGAVMEHIHPGEPNSLSETLKK